LREVAASSHFSLQLRFALIELLVVRPCGVHAFLHGSCCFSSFSGVMFQAGWCGFYLKLQWFEELPIDVLAFV